MPRKVGRRYGGNSITKVDSALSLKRVFLRAMPRSIAVKMPSKYMLKMAVLAFSGKKIGSGMVCPASEGKECSGCPICQNKVCQKGCLKPCCIEKNKAVQTEQEDSSSDEMKHACPKGCLKSCCNPK